MNTALNMTLILLPKSTQGDLTPLMAASFEGHVDIVKILIEAKAQINTQEEVYMLLLPPLHNTSSYTVSLYIHVAVLGELTVCLCPQHGQTALYLAAEAGKLDVVRLLTEAQAQVNIQDEVHPLCHV